MLSSGLPSLDGGMAYTESDAVDAQSSQVLLLRTARVCSVVAKDVCFIVAKVTSQAGRTLDDLFETLSKEFHNHWQHA
jgi:hypothetical protein